MIFNITMKTKVIGVNEWAKTGDKGKPQPDGFTPEGGLVRSLSLLYHESYRIHNEHSVGLITK